MAKPVFTSLLVALALFVSFLMIVQARPAAVRANIAFTVNSTADAIDASPGDGFCDDGAGNCTLRAAIMEANGLPGADTIVLPAPGATMTVYALTIAGTGEDASATGDLDITDDLTITGDGQTITIIDGGGTDRVFDIHFGTVVDIADLTIRNGSAGGGGGILNASTLTITNSTMSNNSASAGDGGGIASGVVSGSILTLVNSTVSGNTAGRFGGGIKDDNSSTMTIIDSIVTGNTASSDGGGIWNSRSTLSVTNSTVSGNIASGKGGGIAHGLVGAVTLMITHTTISDNMAVTGGGIHNAGGTATLKNTIVANNISGGDCGGAGATSLGHNLDSDGTCGLSGPGDISGIDPLLGPLADNGGPTETHALLPGSPAIDAVPLADCTDPDGNPIITDQRGVARPQGPACDIGAFELEPLPPLADLSVTNADSPDPVFVGDPLTFSISVVSNASSTAPAIDVEVTDQLPSSMTFVSAAASQGRCEELNGTVVCRLGDLAIGASATATIVVIPTVEGRFVNTAIARAVSPPDPDISNNRAVQSAIVRNP